MGRPVMFQGGKFSQNFGLAFVKTPEGRAANRRPRVLFSVLYLAKSFLAASEFRSRGRPAGLQGMDRNGYPMRL